MSSVSAPRTKKNGSRRTRISHPLESTPPRESAAAANKPMLNEALDMAARATPEKMTLTSSSSSPLSSSYASSIEAMAAHVEASHSSKKKKRRSANKPPALKSTPYSPSPSNLRKQNGGSSPGSRSIRSPLGARKLFKPQKARMTPLRKAWLVAIPILVSFLVFEAFLWWLVKHYPATVEVRLGTSGVEVRLGASGVLEAIMTNASPIIDREEERVEEVGESDAQEQCMGSDFGSVIEGSYCTPAIDRESANEPRNETDIEENDKEEESIETKLQSMLGEGFARLTGAVVAESEREDTQKMVESLCGNVWETSNEMLASESIKSTEEARSKGGGETSPWEYLALTAQQCLGGAGLAFLTGDADGARLGVSMKIFGRLSYAQPYDPDVRAGLGTSLLIQGIFRNEKSESGVNETDTLNLLELASYHLKVASSLYSALYHAPAGAGDEIAASTAAILHNLALTSIALGDNKNAVSILMRAATLRQGNYTDTKLYWNAPHEVLQAVEEKALLLAAKIKKPGKTTTKKRIPFFR